MHRLIPLVAILAIAACKTQSPVPVATPVPDEPASAPATAIATGAAATEQPLEITEDMYEPTYGERVTIVGELDMARVAGGKRLQPTVLTPDAGGESLLLSYRPVPKWFAFVERRVKVTGRPYTPSPYTQHVLAPHFEAEEIVLEDGSVPPAIDSLPAAPTAAAAGELPQAGRWVRVVGTLTRIENEEDNWGDGILTLGDGTEVRVFQLALSKMKPREGKKVSVVGTVSKDEQATLIGLMAICDGDDAECGRGKR